MSNNIYIFVNKNKSKHAYFSDNISKIYTTLSLPLTSIKIHS